MGSTSDSDEERRVQTTTTTAAAAFVSKLRRRRRHNLCSRHRRKELRRLPASDGELQASDDNENEIELVKNEEGSWEVKFGGTGPSDAAQGHTYVSMMHARCTCPEGCGQDPERPPADFLVDDTIIGQGGAGKGSVLSSIRLPAALRPPWRLGNVYTCLRLLAIVVAVLLVLLIGSFVFCGALYFWQPARPPTWRMLYGREVRRLFNWARQLLRDDLKVYFRYIRRLFL